MIKLNIGCGENKIKGFINIDGFLDSADLKHDIIKNGPLPYADNSIDDIVMFHCIEHIEKKYHDFVLGEFYRLLKPGGDLVISFPEFKVCADNWIKNYKDNRKFWEATIFGRQKHPGDFHISLMDSITFKDQLEKNGFRDIYSTPEPAQLHNTVIFTKKGLKPIPYELMIAHDMAGVQIE